MKFNIEEVDFEDFIIRIRDRYCDSFEFWLDHTAMIRSIAGILGQMGHEVEEIDIDSALAQRRAPTEKGRNLRQIFNLMLELDVMVYDTEREKYKITRG